MSRYYVERDGRLWRIYDRREPYNRAEFVAACRDADTAFRISDLLNGRKALDAIRAAALPSNSVMGPQPKDRNQEMRKPEWTPGPWRLKDRGNIGYAIEGPTSRSMYDGDDGYRMVATYQAACGSERCRDQEINHKANGCLIAAAPELYEALDELFRFSSADLPGRLNAIALMALAKARGGTP